jgi:phage shock protein C
MGAKKLVRSRSNVMIGGVCAGLGEYLGIDPTLVRLFFVLLTFANGAGVLIYFFLWVLIPREDRVEEASFETNVRAGADEIAERARELGKDFQSGVSTAGPQVGMFIGLALILLGGVFFLENLNVAWLSGLRSMMWPVLLILAGVILLLRQVRGE